MTECGGLNVKILEGEDSARTDTINRDPIGLDDKDWYNWAVLTAQGMILYSNKKGQEPKTQKVIFDA
ncbi:unnamed protein product [Clavelina lepadiformis]|uniref:Uncharacterized protein n=1 Tax=Clavelina lepadiformis TaxID=159417 RepID=A0ABP0FTN0_CLALP